MHSPLCLVFIFQNTLTNFQSELVAFRIAAGHESFAVLCLSCQKKWEVRACVRFTKNKTCHTAAVYSALCWGKRRCRGLHACLFFERFTLKPWVKIDAFRLTAHIFQRGYETQNIEITSDLKRARKFTRDTNGVQIAVSRPWPSSETWLTVRPVRR